MNIAILTHPLRNNYGGLLQNYALQMILNELGHTPITLDYTPRNQYNITKKILSIIKRLILKAKGERISWRGWQTAKEMAFISKNTKGFIHSYIKTTEPFYLDNIANILPRNIDAIIVGSDQVWNPNYAKPIEKFYLSDFTNFKGKRIAYAASFGTEDWLYNDNETTICSKLLSEFDGISVRELSGIDFVRKKFSQKASLVLDPTLLIEKKYYEEIAKHSDIVFSKETMMCYVLDKSLQKDQIINKASKHLGLEAVQIMPKANFNEVGPRGLDSCIFPSVEDWLKGFIDSKFVITDSFHGTVFAIIFNKPFISILNRERGADRFYSLLDALGLSDRLITSNDDLSKIIDKSIDFNTVNNILYKEKIKSINFLTQSLC